MQYDILVYGPTFCDIIFTDLPGIPTLGTEVFAGDLNVAVGGSAIVAAGLHRLGLRVGLIADLGTDPFSQIVRNLLDDLGLQQRLIREHPHPLPRTTVALSFPSDRAFVTRFQAPDSPIDLGKTLGNHPARHLHICSFLAALETPAAADLAHANGMTVSMDPGWDERALRDPRLVEMVAVVDLFLPNRMELCHMAAAERMVEAATAVRSTMAAGSTLIVKQGAAGATAFSGTGEERTHVGTLPITAVDTTGAGDAFDAGFLYGFVNGWPIETAMRYGAICGGLSTTGIGGISSLPTLTEVESWRRRLP